MVLFKSAVAVWKLPWQKLVKHRDCDKVLLESQNLASTWNTHDLFRAWVQAKKKSWRVKICVKVNTVSWADSTQAWGLGRLGFNPNRVSDFVQILEPLCASVPMSWMDLLGFGLAVSISVLLRGFPGVPWGWWMTGGVAMLKTQFNAPCTNQNMKFSAAYVETM